MVIEFYWCQAVDLGPGRSVVIDFYCLRNDGTASHALRSWELQVYGNWACRAPCAEFVWQGSDDGIDWKTLTQHLQDQSLAAAEFSVAAWPVIAESGFRHFRVLQV